jgi:hypothetical protein
MLRLRKRIKNVVPRHSPHAHSRLVHAISSCRSTPLKCAIASQLPVNTLPRTSGFSRSNRRRPARYQANSSLPLSFGAAILSPWTR